MTDAWTAVEAAPAPPQRPPQPLRGLAQAVVALTVVVIVGQAVQVGFLRQTGTFPGWGVDPPGTAAAAWATVVSIVFGLVGWAQIAVSLVWMYRASDNVSRFGMRDRQWGPGWAVGSWFIPLANLVLPLFALNEIWRGSDPDATPEGWKRRPVSPLIAWMWAFWVGQQVLTYAFSFALGARMVQEILAGREPAVAPGTLFVLTAVAAALYAVSGVLYILFIQRVGRMQEQRTGARMPAAPF